MAIYSSSIYTNVLWNLTYMKRNRLNPRKIMTLKQLAANLGISYSTLRRWLKDEKPPTNWLYDADYFLQTYSNLVTKKRPVGSKGKIL